LSAFLLRVLLLNILLLFTIYYSLFTHYFYNCSSANSASLLRTTPSKLIVALPENVLNFSSKFNNLSSSFDVIMTGVGEKKIEVIKALRDITGKGLKDSKDIADKTVHDPQVIKEGAGKEDAEEIKKKLEGAGASVELK
jgi:ribosomal protein L7/L12